MLVSWSHAISSDYVEIGIIDAKIFWEGFAQSPHTEAVFQISPRSYLVLASGSDSVRVQHAVYLLGTRFMENS